MQTVRLTADAADAIEEALASKNSALFPERQDYDALAFGVVERKTPDEAPASFSHVVEVISRRLAAAGGDPFEWAREEGRKGQACFFGLRYDRISNSPAWALIHWMPKEVREKATDRALQNVGRQTLMDGLFALRPCVGHEVHDFACHDLDDLNREALLASVESDRAKECVTRTEALLAWLGKPPRAYGRANMKALAPHGTNRFNARLLDPPKFVARLLKFNDTQEEGTIGIAIDETTNVLTMEEVQPFGGSLANLASRLHAKMPRYYLIHFQSATAFILWCPEGSSKRLRFLYAACKVAAARILLQHGTNFDAVCDVRNPQALEKVFAVEESEWAPLSALFSVKPRPPCNEVAA